MKIAYIASSEFGCPPPPDQIQAALWICGQVITGMTKRGHETIYVGAGVSTVEATKIITMGKAFFDLYRYEEWVQLPTAAKDQTLSTYQTKLHMFLVDQAKLLDVDLVHYHSSPPIFMLPFSGSIEAPKVHTFHDPLYSWYGPIFEQYKEITSNYYVSISDAQRRDGPNLPFIDTVYNGIPIEMYQYGANPEDQLLFLGRIKKIKGVKDAITVAKMVNIPLVIAGRTAMTEKQFIDEEITPHVDGERVKQIGVVESIQKVKLLMQSKALLFPIQWEEPFGLVMVEAMACGTPVIAYNRGSVSEIVRDGVTGFIVDPERGVDGLVEAVRRIGEIDRAACRRHVEENFTVEKMVAGYERVYQKVLGS